MAIEKGFFRQVMGRFATGVTVVTAQNQNTLGGLTVNSFCSVSLEPPLVLVCIDLRSSTLALIRESKAFAINILTDQQEHLSRCFAIYSKERQECFCHAPYHEAATGSPILDDVLAFIDARVVAEYPGGDHVIMLGEVMALGTSDHMQVAHDEEGEPDTLSRRDGATPFDKRSPLAYFQGKYRHLADSYETPSLAAPYEESAR